MKRKPPDSNAMAEAMIQVYREVYNPKLLSRLLLMTLGELAAQETETNDFYEAED